MLFTHLQVMFIGGHSAHATSYITGKGQKRSFQLPLPQITASQGKHVPGQPGEMRLHSESVIQDLSKEVILNWLLI